MSIDVVFFVLSILGHTILGAYLYWRKPMTVGRIGRIFLCSSCFAWAANSLGLIFGLWEFPSPVLGVWGTMLIYNTILFPIKVVSLILFWGASWRLNAAAIIMLSLSCFIGEGIALRYSSLVVYLHWNLYLTFFAFCLTYCFFGYLFAAKRKHY
jgi:hypothetical protein